MIRFRTNMYIDSHAHFDLMMEDGASGDAESIMRNMREHKISRAVQVSIDADGLDWSLSFAKQYRSRGLLFTAGIHPSSEASERDLEKLSSFVARVMASEDAPLLLGIGECGLDYFRMRQPQEAQVRSFERQIDIAKRFSLPVIVHTREAMVDTLALLGRKLPGRGIMHCFSGNAADARRVLDLGFHLSFAGNVTYKSATDLQEAVKFAPLDRLLVETDAPFLTPVPLRGKKNRPEYVIHTYEFIARIRKEPLETVTDAVLRNFSVLCDTEPQRPGSEAFRTASPDK